MEMEVDTATAADNNMPSSSSATASRKKLRLAMRGRKPPPPTPPQTRWRSSTQEKIYGRRLLEALRSTAAGAGATPHRPRAIKEAADSALAATAQGRSKWSRAILRRQWRMRKLLVKAGGKVRGRGRCNNKGSRAVSLVAKPAVGVMSGKKVRERLRVLSKMVPGCKKASTPKLLEEAADYVAALELQVKAMRALADALSSSSYSSSSSSSSAAAAAAAAATAPPDGAPQGSSPQS
uniref:Transcription factor bHLH149 n=1 Tax=Anthurium amnicola TaxID=1678845 RepID=A0A1D1YE84_9ARAE